MTLQELVVKKEKPAPRPDTPRVDEPGEVSAPKPWECSTFTAPGPSLFTLCVRLIPGRGGERAGHHLPAETAEGKKHPVQGPNPASTCASAEPFSTSPAILPQSHKNRKKSLIVYIFSFPYKNKPKFKRYFVPRVMTNQKTASLLIWCIFT